MAQLEVPPAGGPGTADGRPPPAPARWAGDDAVPRGLAVSSAITLRVIVVVGKRLRLHPVAILLALTAGGVLAGVAGAFLAIPVAAVISAVLDYMRTHRAEERSQSVVTP